MVLVIFYQPTNKSLLTWISCEMSFLKGLWKNALFYYGSNSLALILLLLCSVGKLKCSAFKLGFYKSNVYFALPASNSNWTQTRTPLKRTAEGGDGEESGLMINHHLWKERGNKLPTDLRFERLLKPEKQTSLEMALGKMPVCGSFSHWSACGLTTGKNQWEGGKVTQHQVICIRAEGWPQTGAGLWLCFITSNLADAGHLNPLSGLT